MSENGWVVTLILVLVLMCAGDPDLLDAIVKLVMSQAK